MAMSKRDYEAFARLLNKSWVGAQGSTEKEALVVRITGDIADVLAQYGKNFDRTRFLQVCFRLN